MKTLWGALALAGATLLTLGSALAGDAPPAPPSCPAVLAVPSQSLRPPPPMDRPIAPACVDLKTHIARCRHGELEKYNAAIDRYNDAMESYNKVSSDYVDALNRYTESAGAYSHCEIEAMNAQIKRASAKP